MKKTITIIFLVVICTLSIMSNVKHTVAPITKTVHDIVVPKPAEVLPDPISIVLEVRQLARLETSTVTLERIVRTEKDNQRFWGAFGEILILVAHGEAIAGVDMGYFNYNDVHVIDINTVKIHLPQAEIFNVILDNQLSYIAFRSKGAFATTDPQLETKTRIRAQQILKENALDLNILEIAKKNAQNTIRSLLQKFKFKTIIFI